MLTKESESNFSPVIGKFIGEGKIAVIRVNDEAIGFAVETEQAAILAKEIKQANRYKVRLNVTCRWEDRAAVIAELMAGCKKNSDLGWLSIADNYRQILRKIKSWEGRITA